MHFLIKWYLMSTCFVVAWLTGFWARRSAAWLSIYNLVGPGVPLQSSERSWHSQTSSLEASAAAMYSTCVEEIAMVLCCFEDQEMAPPEYRKVYPEIKWWLRWSLAWSISLYPMSSDSPMVYMMPWLGHPVRYHMMCLTPLMWSRLNMAVYGESDPMTMHTYIGAGPHSSISQWTNCLKVGIWRNRHVFFSRCGLELGSGVVTEFLVGAGRTHWIASTGYQGQILCTSRFWAWGVVDRCFHTGGGGVPVWSSWPVWCLLILMWV